jgi:hypothetical protein
LVLGCVGFQSGAQAFTTQMQQWEDLKGDYKNLRAQCYFKLAEGNDYEMTGTGEWYFMDLFA